MAEKLRNNDFSGWLASLDLVFAAGSDRTVLQKNRHSGPLRVQRPLYPEDRVCHTYILHPPGGIVGGDRLELNISVASHAHALSTTPGATKFYRSNGLSAHQQNTFWVSENATFEWLPQETIFFPGSNVNTATRINLGKQARFIGWEILCFGLAACGQPFSSGKLGCVVEVYRENKPLLVDRLRILEASDLRRPAGLRDRSVAATFVATACDKNTLEQVQRLIDAAITDTSMDLLAGATLIDDVLIVRSLSDDSATVKGLFNRLWSLLRPLITQYDACPPRVWAT